MTIELKKLTLSDQVMVKILQQLIKLDPPFVETIKDEIEPSVLVHAGYKGEINEY
jgi:restriction endonuclease Mrr